VSDDPVVRVNPLTHVDLLIHDAVENHANQRLERFASIRTRKLVDKISTDIEVVGTISIDIGDIIGAYVHENFPKGKPA